MNWKLVLIVVAIIVFVFLGGINATKKGLDITKNQISKVKSDLNSFVTKQNVSQTTTSNGMVQKAV